MFKSLQWKMVTIFILFVLAIMTAAGTFLIFSVTNFYHTLFVSEMEAIFNDKFIVQLSEGVKNEPEYISRTISAYTARLGIDSYRNYYIIDEAASEVIGASVENFNDSIEKTPNLIKAYNGEIGKKVNTQSGYMDFAVPIQSNSAHYIIYIRDSKVEINQIIQKMFTIILQALMIGILIALILGYLLSKTITTPISNLTKKAKKLSEGEFESKIEVNSDDEIGTLTQTFNDMSSKLYENLLEISKEKNKVETMLQNMTDGVIAFGTDGKIIHINQTAKRLLNIDDYSKTLFDDFFRGFGMDIKIGDMLYFEDKKEDERDIILNNSAFKANFVVLDDELNNISGVLVVIHDITKQQKLEESRKEFVANVSHELRTPLTTIKSYTETILEMVADNPVASSFANTVLNEADRMTRLVKDLLVLSSLDHKNELNKTKFSFNNLISDVVETLSLVAKEQGHRLTYEAITPLPNFNGDRDKLEQVLYNIISNSIKYTPNGGKIEVFAGRVYNDVYVKVKDNGIGIPKKDINRIFERFYRVDKARSRASGGTGLGLAISKGIVESHHGNIRIESKAEEGTEVIITLPLL